MSDIHGMYDKYIAMLRKINFSSRDVLYVLGDVIDRGNDSIKILKDMMLRDNVYGIIGNHEVMAVECLRWLCSEITDELLDDLDEKKMNLLSDWIANGADKTIREFKKLDEEEKLDIIDYLGEWSAYEEIEVNNEHYILVHSGLGHFDKDKSLDEYDLNDLVWDRPDFDHSYYDDKYVIVGHTPTLSINGSAKIYHNHNFIDIDCGACFDNGKLACLCLDTKEEFYI